MFRLQPFHLCHRDIGFYKGASMRLLVLRFFLLALLFSGEPMLAIQQEQSEKHSRVASSILEPVYGPLAEQIVADFRLTDKKGIGIDLGSGPGNLIIELCRRTKQMHWVNADIDSRSFPDFMKKAHEAGFDDRVSAIYADAIALPFHDDYAEIIVSRGSFQFWTNLQVAFADIYRVLKPGGAAFIGRGFPENLPIELARRIRAQQREGGFVPDYDVASTARELRSIMESLKIADYRIRIPAPSSADNINYGIWIDFHKPPIK
jgi:SAM-dependent methyltransferase